MNHVMLTEIIPSTSVNITFVLSTMKMNGELLIALKDTHQSGVIVHLKLLLMNVQDLGIVMISSLSPLIG